MRTVAEYVEKGQTVSCIDQQANFFETEADTMF